MKSFLKIIIILVSLLLVSACATTSIEIPNEYNLDNQLERLKEISDLRAGRNSPQFNILGVMRPTEDWFEPEPSTEGTAGGMDTLITQLNTMILSVSKDEWIKVDQQSLILRGRPGEYYLLVLRRPSPELLTSEYISFTSSFNVIRAGVDSMTVMGNINFIYVIDRIYRIKSNEEMAAIKSQILRRHKDPESIKRKEIAKRGV